MIVVQRRRGLLAYRVVWFDPAPKLLHLVPTVYRQSPTVEAPFGLRRESFHSLRSHLMDSDDGLLAAMNATSRNEIRQAQRAGAEGRLETIDRFVDHHNGFALSRDLEQVTRSRLLDYGDSLMVTSVQVNGLLLAMHALLLDPQSGRARLLHSSSSRFLHGGEKALAGKANRWLHWWEMLALRDRNYSTYDWGGVAPGTLDPRLQGVNRFKASFGGEPVEESNLYPLLRPK